jgi:hypothetical protein
MELYKMYSHELVVRLDELAVYRPGYPVFPGDIITFGANSIGNWKPPIGNFTKYKRLNDFGQKLDIDISPDARNIRYSSFGGTSTKIDNSVSLSAIGGGKISVSFKKAGSILIIANAVKEHTIDISKAENILEKNKHLDIWKDHYIVVGVSVAESAVVMQSSSDMGALEMDAIAAVEGGGLESVKTVIKTTSCNDSAFFLDWSENVALFFRLVRYGRKNMFSSQKGLKHLAKKEESEQYELHEFLPIEIINWPNSLPPPFSCI